MNSEEDTTAVRDAEDKGTGENQAPSSSQQKATSATCIPKATERIKVDLPSHHINSEIQYMQDHALIGKFLGFWPNEKALHGWIASKWKPKGQVTLQLGPKGFFTAIFYCIEDKSRIFEGRPYFFNSSGLYLRDWKPRFNLDKEDFSWAPVWVRMYSLSVEYWREETLADIGNKLGNFIKVAEETKTRRYTSYAKICVQMHLTKALVDSVSLYHDDFEWNQPLDYEHIPFRCQKCHEHGHLFRDCPMNSQNKPQDKEANKDSEGFTKVPNRRRHAKKNQAAPENPFKPDSQNRFILLSSPNQPATLSSASKESSSHPSTSFAPSAPKSPPMPFPTNIISSSLSDKSPALNASSFPSSSEKSGPEPIQQPSAMELDAALALSLQDTVAEEDQSLPTVMEEDPEKVSLDGLDIFKLETACKQKEFNSIPPWQIDRLEGVLSKAQRNINMGIQAGSPWDGKKILKETKKRGRKTDLQRTIIVGELLMESGRFPKLTKFYKPKPHGSS